MAIAYDNSGKGSDRATATTTIATNSFAVGSGSDRVLVVGVVSDDTTVVNPSAVKWGGSGGTSLTQVSSTLDIGANVKLSLWRLIAPTTQTSTVHVTWGSTQSGRGVVAVAYTGVDQTTPLRTAAPATDTLTDVVSASATSVADDLVVAIFSWLQNSGNNALAAPGAGQTSRQEIEGTDLKYDGLLISDKTATTTSTAMSYQTNEAVDSIGIIAAALIPATAGSPATLSSATPSGTLGTSTTATLGATTDQTTGTVYGVVDTAGNISGITAAQVKAGQNNASAAAVAASNSAVSTTTPSTGVTGLTASTAYSYAVVQNNANGDSNVLTGTFTTAAPSATPKGMLLMGVG